MPRVVVRRIGATRDLGTAGRAMVSSICMNSVRATMKTNRWTSLLAERPWLLADGAMGSNLFARGLTSGDAPELWNTEHPQRISELQRSFVEAGADILLTNSFGANRHRLKLHRAEGRVAELNEVAARLAR